MSEYEYTVAICSYNMAETLEQSLRSVLSQLDNRFEVLVVDESTDESPAIIQSLQSEFQSVRMVQPAAPTSSLAQARNISIRRARGKHVITHVDVDDEYLDHYILQIVDIYEKLIGSVGDIYISFNNLNIAPKSFLLNGYLFRDLPIGAEDYDLWWRLINNGDLINIDHRPICKEIDTPGRKQKLRYTIRRAFDDRTGKFQIGSPLNHILINETLQNGRLNWKDKLIMISIVVPAFIRSKFAESFESPTENWSNLENEFDHVTYNIKELNEKYGINIEPLERK